MDASYWCYECDTYVTNDVMTKMRIRFGEIKFENEDKFSVKSS